jgi:hypothetical protein
LHSRVWSLFRHLLAFIGSDSAVERVQHGDTSHKVGGKAKLKRATVELGRVLIKSRLFRQSLTASNDVCGLKPMLKRSSAAVATNQEGLRFVFVKQRAGMFHNDCAHQRLAEIQEPSGTCCAAGS